MQAREVLCSEYKYVTYTKGKECVKMNRSQQQHQINGFTIKSPRGSKKNTTTKLVQNLVKSLTQKASKSQMKQSSSIDEVETWLEGIMTYKSVAKITKSHSHHTN